MIEATAIVALCILNNQCDQMVFTVFIIWPFTAVKNCSLVTIFAKY